MSDDVLERMRAQALTGGNSDKLNNPQLSAKLNKIWAQAAEKAAEIDASPERQYARNRLIHAKKGLDLRERSKEVAEKSGLAPKAKRKRKAKKPNAE